MQMVEYEQDNMNFMCTTCMKVHLARPNTGVNVCVSGSQLHNIHTPRYSTSPAMNPDPVHIDWLTVCGATIAELEYAWMCDYKYQARPMRILLSAGLDYLAKGKLLKCSFISKKLLKNRTVFTQP